MAYTSAIMYRLRYVSNDGSENYFDRREGTDDLNERLDIISNVLNSIGYAYDAFGEAYITGLAYNKAIIDMTEKIEEVDVNGIVSVVGSHTDNFFLTIDLTQTVINYWDPNNPFDLRVADRV